VSAGTCHRVTQSAIFQLLSAFVGPRARRTWSGCLTCHTSPGDIIGLPAARVNARSGRVCMFVCANVHAPFLSKAPYSLESDYLITRTHCTTTRPISWATEYLRTTTYAAYTHCLGTLGNPEKNGGSGGRKGLCTAQDTLQGPGLSLGNSVRLCPDCTVGK